MASQELILCIDIGGSSIKAAEFSFPSGQTPVLEKFAYAELDDELEKNDSPAAVAQAVVDMIKANGFQQNTAHISVSGQNAYIPFIKVPALTKNKDKIAELVAYEAEQKIPSSLNDVSWDYQLIEQPDPGAQSMEIDAMLVSVKNEIINALTRAFEKLGKNIKIIEVAPTACFNTAKANSIGEERCEMILNIGGKSSTLIFLDGKRFYIRSIPIAGESITQQIMKEFSIGKHEAEEMKRRYASVPMDNAPSENAIADSVGKIVKGVMTRLYGDVVRTMNLYRSSQGGRNPEKLYLAGGSSVIPFVPEYFSDKLKISAEYFNPFHVVSVGKGVDQEMLTNLAHLFSETIGLSLRQVGTCPIEIALVPAQVRKQIAFRAKYPYFYASAACLLVYLGLSYWAFTSQLENINAKSEEFQAYIEKKQSMVSSVESAQGKLSGEEKKFKQAANLLAVRNNWANLFNIIQNAAPSNMWFTGITVSEGPSVQAAVSQSEDKNSGEGGMGGMGMLFRGGMGGGGGGGSRDGDSDFRPGGMPGGMMGGMGGMMGGASASQAPVVMEKTWLNIQGHVVTNVPNAKDSQVGLEQVNLFIDQLIQPGSVFVLSQKDNPRAIFHESTEEDTNITGFELSLEMTSPINVVSKKKNRDR